MTTPDDVQQLVIPRHAVTEMHTTLTEFAEGHWDGFAVNRFADLRDQLGAWLQAPGDTTPAADRLASPPPGALAGREQRRRTTANILARIDRSKHIQEDEATLLRTLVTAEQADADQAREQLAAARAGDAPWITAYREDLTAEHDTHEQHRTALAAALYCPEDIQWGRLIRAAEQTAAGRRTWRDKAHEMEADAVQARRGEAEAVRAREAAERDRDAAWREAGAARIRSGRTLAEARRNRDAWRNARKRAADLATLYDVRTQEANGWHAQAEAARKTVRDYENRLSWETTCGEHARLLDSCRAADERAERAEATLTAVRKAVAGRRAEVADYEAERPPSAWSDAVAVTCDRVEEAIAVAALGDPQPANEPERCGQYGGHGEYCDYPREPGSEQCTFHAAEARTHDAEPDDPCAHGCRQAADDLTRLGQEIDAEAEQPAEPEPDAPCFHPSWETEPTVGARKCTDCGEWLDPEPPAEPVGAALWAAIRDHAARDIEWWKRQCEHLNSLADKGLLL